MKLARSWFLVVLTALAGCTVQMAYNHLDRLARWSLDDYVRLNDDQQQLFDARFEALWRWHRHDQLPRYADFLESLPARLDDGVSDSELEAMAAQFITWAGEIEDRALPPAAEVLATLTDAQVNDLAAALERRNHEVAQPEAGVPVAEAQKKWAREFADRFTWLSGRLEPFQRAWLDGQARGYRPELLLWADYRRRWQTDFLALLADRRDAAALQARLRRLIDDRERYYGPTLTAVEAHNEALARRVSVWLLNSLSERQRQHAADRLTELAQDFRELAAE